jgi:uncharacterized membrane protein YbhN (UPF0104 family)
VVSEEEIQVSPGELLTRGTENYGSGFSRFARSCLVAGASVACLVYIWKTFAWSDIALVVRKADAILFLVGSSSTLLVYCLLRGLRWQLLLRTVRAANADFLSVYLCTASSFALSIVTPVQSGEALKVEMLKRVSSVKRVEGYGCFAVERMFDLLCVLQLAFFAVALGLGREMGLSASMIGVCAALLCAVFVLAAYVSTMFGPWKERFASMLGALAARPSCLFTVWMLSTIAWCIVALGWGICLASVGIRLSISELGLLTSGVTMINILSLIPGAVGISEVSTCIALKHFGVPEVQAQAGVLMLRAYVVILLLLGLLHAALFYLIEVRAKSIHHDTEDKS